MMRVLILASLMCAPVAARAQDAPPAPAPEKSRRVEVQSLDLREVGAWGAASLPEGLRPLPSDLWQKANPDTLAVIFSKLSPDQRFPSLQILVRRAVFSGGSAPLADTAPSRGRFEAASRLGPADAAAKLLFGVPRLPDDAELAALAIDAGLRAGRIDEACRLIEAVPVPPLTVKWQEARATCYALNNEADAANLSVDLAKSRGLTDTWLARAVAATSGAVSAPPPFRTDSGGALALSWRAKLTPPANPAAITDPAALSALIQTPDFMAGLSPEAHLALLRAGAMRGIVPLPQVEAAIQRIADAKAAALQARLAAEAVAPPSDEPQTSAPSVPEPTAPAAATPTIPSPSELTQAILAAPTLAARVLEARLALPHIRSVMRSQPGLMTLLDVPVLAEAALWSGEAGLAASILALSPDAPRPRLALALALYEPAKRSEAIDARLAAGDGDLASRRLALRDIALMWATGASDGPSGAHQALLLQDGFPWAASGNSGVRAALNLAAKRGSKGEIAVLVGLALQGVDPTACDFETLYVALQALNKVGLTDQARDLARDYLLALHADLPARKPTKAAVAPPASTTKPSPAPSKPAQKQSATPAALRAAWGGS